MSASTSTRAADSVLANLDRYQGMDEDPVLAVQRLYPRIFLACHVRHVRRKSNNQHLSAHDSAILAHLDPNQSVTARDLARHLDVVPSTLSAALARLRQLGYIEMARGIDDRRTRRLALTAQGTAAMSAASVLDPVRLRTALARLEPAEQRTVVLGLTLLARASQPETKRLRRTTQGSR